jgi:hypothetical protein
LVADKVQDRGEDVVRVVEVQREEIMENIGRGTRHLAETTNQYIASSNSVLDRERTRNIKAKGAGRDREDMSSE